MIFYARTEKDAMAVIIDNGAKKAEQVNPVGKMLMEFIYLSAKEVNDAFDMLFTELQQPGDLDGCGLADLIEQYCGGNLYLMCFVESLAEVLINGKISTKAGFERLCAAYASEEAILRSETQFKEVAWQTATKAFVIGLFSLRTLALQSFAREQLEFCMDSTENKLYKVLSTSQRLYLYEQWRMANGEQPLYFGDEYFPSRLVTTADVELGRKKTLENIAAEIKDVNPQVYEMTTLGNVYALLRYEMMKAVTLGVVVKKCANCGRYFVPEGRSDTEYCSRILDDQPEKTCQSVGALLKHQKKVENNRVYQEYQKAYKRHNSRTRQRKMTQSEFLAWSDEARQHRQECLDGKMSEEDFIAWLNRDRVYRREG